MSEVKSLARLIEEAAEDTGVSFRPNYSGRGMYGRSCVGIVGSSQDLAAVMTEVAYNLAPLSAEGWEGNQRLREELESLFQYSSDSMGMGRIFYWQHLALDEQ